MKRAQRFFEIVVGLVIMGALALGAIVAFRVLSSAGTPGALAKTPQGYPPPQATLPPGPTLPPQPTPPIVYANQSPTPWPTFTPLPISTRKPGPTETPLPVPQPAQDSVGVISYVVYEQGDKASGYQGSVRSLDTDKAGMVRTDVAPTIYAIDGSWSSIEPSPNGRQIAVVHGVEGGDIVNIFDADTGKMRAMFKDQAGIGTFLGWHPDSRHVLYVVTTNFTGPSGGLWLVDISTGEVTVIANQQIGSTYAAAVSPDGQKVAYYLSGMAEEIWMINADGSEPRIIYTGKGGYMGAITWSPDGSQIAFLDNGLMVINEDGSNPRVVSQSTVAGYAPVWSPDGRKLAFVTFDGPRPIEEKGAKFDEQSVFTGAAIHTVDLVTGEEQPLLKDSSTGYIDPTWSPDASQIAFASIRGGTPEIWAVNVDGSNLRQLTNSGQLVRFPFWIRAQKP
jgi:WD40 repeat protein